MAPAPASQSSGLLQIIYSSQPFGYDEVSLAGILMDARRCNARDDVTGALICRADIFLQLLEGPEPAVRAAYERIARDDCHLDLVLHAARPVEERLFGAWAMLHDPAASWLPGGAGPDGLARVRATDLLAVFTARAAAAASDAPG